MSLSLRCRGPTRQSTLTGIEASTSVSDFCVLVATKTGVPPEQQEILAGFPPKPLELPQDRASVPVSSLPLASGDTIVVRELPGPPPQPPVPAVVPPMAAVPPDFPSNGPHHQQQQQQQQSIEDAEMAAAIAASLGQDVGCVSGGSVSAASAPAAPTPPAAPPPSSGPAAAAGAPGRSAASQGATPTSAPVRRGGGSYVVRRVIESDNSCLFNAVSSILHVYNLCAHISMHAVRADPFKYNEAFLGMDNAKYCSWITSPDKWGGAIELSILSSFYGREIAAFDIQTQRMDVYGQDQGYSEQVMLLYDGLHYDAMAMTPIQDGPEELDITKFETSAPDAQDIQQAARLLVQAAHEARQFTNTASFTLRCGVCQVGLKGEKEAVQHAASTSHSNFQEY
ncbi:hypothetical protein DUNSADRAFT_3986 [Dunaliella salina]|uniref:Ubiquitin thioesterase OTU n=1 Tax=Dunaliella salina TaxID=3046 RepID=A0ABQ7GSZ0_DUNSA|nr:hypothetical protein DUNSADRAFT_3986 [Dunaliella salina]|eukprot:KAF5837731.1 hypothetical protein DUNSADRAFT_3986 [Dunaliella salina]